MSDESWQIINYVTPEVNGLLWVSKNHLTERPWPFSEMDYLCNGQLTKLTQQLREESSSQNKPTLPQLISTKQFNKPFFICQVQARDTDQTLKYLSQSIKAQLSNIENKKGTILFINTTEYSLISKLKSSFSKMTFISPKKEELKEWTKKSST